MAEPTSALTFSNLILEVARKMGVGYFGANGDEALQVPVDAHDLAEAKRHVNNAIRMVIASPPPSGWRWTKPVASLVLWPSVTTGSGITVSGGAASGGATPLTASAAVFHPSMEGKEIVITGVGTFTMLTYTSSTSMSVTGDASSASGATFSIDADGSYTLPQTFGGTYSGVISYAAGTNVAVRIEWTSEGVIRQWREVTTVDTGDPRHAAVRIKPDDADDRRRWELMVYPTPEEELTVQFQYDLHFDSLTDLTDKPPTPYAFDELIKSACLAVVEQDVDEIEGVATNRYREALARAYLIDARSGPKKLGYFGNPTMPRRMPTGEGRDRINFPVGFNP